jgi:hypothetical protein
MHDVRRWVESEQLKNDSIWRLPTFELSLTTSETFPSWPGRASNDPVKPHRVAIASDDFPLPFESDPTSLLDPIHWLYIIRNTFRRFANK